VIDINSPGEAAQADEPVPKDTEIESTGNAESVSMAFFTSVAEAENEIGAVLYVNTVSTNVPPVAMHVAVWTSSVVSV
jgi:hypothetical protein